MTVFFHLGNTSFHLLEKFKMKGKQSLPPDSRNSWKCEAPGLAGGEKHQHNCSLRPKLKPSAQSDCDVAITFHHIKCVITVHEQVMWSDSVCCHHRAVWIVFSIPDCQCPSWVFLLAWMYYDGNNTRIDGRRLQSRRSELICIEHSLCVCGRQILLWPPRISHFPGHPLCVISFPWVCAGPGTYF